MKVSLFDFDLPQESIAQRPVSPRDSARLLEVNPDGLADHIIRDLPTLLRPGDLLVSNNTRVIPARLTGKRGEAKVEVTLHKAEAIDQWRAFAKPARKLRPGDSFTVSADFSATVIEKGEDGEVLLQFNREGPALFEALHQYGTLPLPPYIRRNIAADDKDSDDYQTIFAEKEGAVAAPTAGLHFTPALLDALDARGVQRLAITLHVGAGTFLPVKVDNTEDHRMHYEYGELDQHAADLINRTRQEGGRIVAVGTTSLRLLESAADETGTVHPFADQTNLFITPGYRFRAVDVLLTNFHLPRSTLFMLVSAFAGMERMRTAYKHAIHTGYRFYSYGDACLLHREDSPS